MHIEPKFSLNADVVVCGAGTAGAVAAIAAADAGASVILVEQFGSAGGSGSVGLVTPLMSNNIKGIPQGSYVGQEIMARMVKDGLASEDGKSYFDPVMLGMVLEEMLAERHVTMMYNTTVVGVNHANGHVDRIIVFNKSGFGEVTANNKYIDCTGDCDVVALAGLPFLQGDEEEHKNQPCSLRYMVGSVDVHAFWDFLQTVRNPENPLPFTGKFTGAVTLHKEWPLSNLFREAVANGDLAEEDMAYWQFFTVPGRADCIAFNCPEFFDVPDTTNAKDLSRVQVQGKLRIMRHLRFYKKYLPGFEHASVNTVSAMVSIRESRRAVTEYVLTNEDALSWRKFDDAIARTNYPVDVHGYKLNNKEIINDRSKEEPYYEIPLRTLIVKDMDNLLVAGRNLGSEFMAQASVRIIPTCRALGEAAGIAAALNTTDAKRVREVMIEKGADM